MAPDRKNDPTKSIKPVKGYDGVFEICLLHYVEGYRVGNTHTKIVHSRFIKVRPYKIWKLGNILLTLVRVKRPVRGSHWLIGLNENIILRIKSGPKPFKP